MSLIVVTTYKSKTVKSGPKGSVKLMGSPTKHPPISSYDNFAITNKTGHQRSVGQ